MSIAPGEAEGDRPRRSRSEWVCHRAIRQATHSWYCDGVSQPTLEMGYMGYLGGLGCWWEHHRPRCPTHPVLQSENSTDWVRS